MANWFKIFETDLDESRMRFALSRLPEVWPVWVAILMECCKHRSDSFSWGTDSQELFGFSDRLKISIPKVNEAVKLLCEIRYTKLDECGTLKVLKWSEKQDDYLARKSRGYWENRRESKKITVNHSESHIEERRGEDKKREREETPALSEIPSWNEFWEFCQSPQCGIAAEWFAKDKYLSVDDWSKKRDWRKFALRVRGWWDNDGRPMTAPKKNGADAGPKKSYLQLPG